MEVILAEVVQLHEQCRKYYVIQKSKILQPQKNITVHTADHVSGLNCWKE